MSEGPRISRLAIPPLLVTVPDTLAILIGTATASRTAAAPAGAQRDGNCGQHGDQYRDLTFL